MKKEFSFMILTLLLTSTLALAFNIHPARAEPQQSPTGWYWPAGTGDTGGYLGFLDWNPIFNGWHLAQDFKLDQGLPVYAMADGEVVLSRTDVGGYGHDGTSGGALVARFETSAEEFFITLYGHIDSPHAEGRVEAGQILGYINDYDPPHLHFGIHPGYELPENPWRGYTYDESETYGWIDPVQFLLNNHPHVPINVRVKTDTFGDGTIKSLDIESEYLPIVVASENPHAPYESMKAQAIASRTFVLYKINYEPQSDEFDVYDDERDQVYDPQRFTALSEFKQAEIKRAVRETRNIVLKWKGVIICAFFVSGTGDTAEYVTYNEGKTGDDITQTTLGWVTDPPSKNPHNRGCMGQVQANEIASERGYDYQQIIRYFYGADIEGLPAPLPFVPVDLVLVLDRSGSMGSIMGSKTRMQGAKDSAIAVIDALMPHDRVAVVSFESTATTNVQLTSAFDLAKTEIQKISASGNTCFGAGLKLAVNELKDRGSEDHAWAIIFMSDGWHNTAPSPDSYVDECETLGIPIYTVGLGTYPSDVNEALLKQMAEETGGKYLFAPSLYELQNIFLRFSLEVTGWSLVAEFSGDVGEGETVVAGILDVSPLTSFTRVTLNWPGSDLDLIIIRPDGSEVDLGTGLDNSYSGATAKPEWVILHDPPAGTWTVKVFGKVITSPDEPYIVWISIYVPPTPHDTTPPFTSLTIGAPQHIDPTGKLYVTSATTFTLTSEDNPGGSGVASTFYRVYNGSYDTGWLEYSAPFCLTALSEGEYSIDCYGTDSIGNTEPTNTATVILDNTPPTTTLTIGSPKYFLGMTCVTPETIFTLEVADAGSGRNMTSYCIFNAPYDSGWEICYSTFNLSSLDYGTYTISFNSTDNLGNVEDTLNVTIQVRANRDMNGDNVVDMKDIAIAAKAFGTTPGHPRWNPKVDMNRDNKIDLRDVATIAQNFGTHLS